MNAQNGYSTGNPERLIHEIHSDLDRIFYFSGKNSEAFVLDMSTQIGRETYLRLTRALSKLGIPVEREIEELSEGKLRAVCRYLGRFEGLGTYMIALSKFDERTPLDLGEELTHEEHQVAHDSNRNYDEMFLEPFQEFMGYLGMQHVGSNYAKGNRVKIELIIPQPENAGTFESDASHTIGYSVASELVSKGDVPYRKLFHATDQAKGWRNVNRILRPEIVIKVPDGVETDVASEIIKRNIGSLDAKVELFK